ncbi:MAG: hypothetical protein KIS92_07955 [Planctomycetota bacterium]|nr:hypothetical protein [Planctomycetota bacterium]
MLAHETRSLAPTREAEPRRASGVSQVLRAMYQQPVWPRAQGSDPDAAGFTVLVANARGARERAYRLARRVYAVKGFVDESSDLAQPYDLRPDTATLLASTATGDAAGTITCVCESEDGLPCDEVFPGCLDGLRSGGRRLAEVTRLALLESQDRGRPLLVRLMNLISIYARRVAKADDFVIEVNPRHVPFYLRMLGFEVLAPERPCPRVNGAPAVLLRLDLHWQAERVRALAGTTPEGEAARSLYPHFMSFEAEEDAAALLEFQHRPMSALEALHFKLVDVRKVS